MLGLPDSLAGVIQDSASSATLCAVLTARERATAWRGNADGLRDLPPLAVYASAEAHSSVEKAVRIATSSAAGTLSRTNKRGPQGCGRGVLENKAKSPPPSEAGILHIYRRLVSRRRFSRQPDFAFRLPRDTCR